MARNGGNMGMLKYALALVACVVVANAQAGTEDYKRLGERKPAGQVKTDYYQFNYTAPREVFADIEWDAFADKKEKRNTVMVIGLAGYDTYALSVQYKGPAAEGTDALAMAQSKYPNLSFAPSSNPACVSTAADRPFALDERMVAFVAMCMDATTHGVYELNLSWRAMSLMMQPLDTLIAESRQCAADKLKDPATRCGDRVTMYAASFNTFLTSFATTGK